MKKKLFGLFLFLLAFVSFTGCQKKGIKATFYSDDAIYKTVDVVQGEKIKFPARPSLDGHVFIGWYTEKELIHLFDEETIPEQSISLFGSYETKTTHKHLENKIITEATCTDKGLEVTTCLTCKAKISSKEVDALGHTHEEGAEGTLVFPTCTEKGHTDYICTRCNTLYEAQETPALGHDKNTLLSSVPATCTDVGHEKYHCETCKMEYEVELPALGHNFKDKEDCSQCSTPYFTTGLKFTLNSAKDAYAISGYDGKVSSVYVPKTYLGIPVTAIGDNAFFKKSIISTLVLPNSLLTIGKNAFLGCSSISEINLGDSNLLSIGDYAFKSCSSLKKITLGMKLKNIGTGAFASCTALTEIDLSSTNVESIGGEAFNDCRGMTTITFPTTLLEIGTSAFANCILLKDIDLSQSIKMNNIVDYSFSKCAKIESIALPNSITSIGRGAFENCLSLTTFKMSEGIINIAAEAFSGCKLLKDISFEDSQNLVSLGEKSFYGCSSLPSIYLPFTTTKIGSHAFDGCHSLKNVYIHSTTIAREVSNDTGSYLIRYASYIYVKTGVAVSGYLSTLNNVKVVIAGIYYNRYEK